VLRAGAVLGEQPRPLEDAVDPIDARDVGDALPTEMPGEAPRPVAGPAPPAPQAPGHPGSDLPGVPMGPSGAIGEVQPVPAARRVAVPPLVVRLPGDPEEDTGIGHRAELLGLAEPGQPLSNALFPDTVWHGYPPSWLGGRLWLRHLFYHRKECDPCMITLL